MDNLIYKVVSQDLWQEAEQANVFRGAPVDHEDGFIHLSAANQVAETVSKHFAGQDDLLLVEVDANILGDELRWEESRGGNLFPHLYGELPLNAVRSVLALPLKSDGTHVLPDRFQSYIHR